VVYHGEVSTYKLNPLKVAVMDNYASESLQKPVPYLPHLYSFYLFYVFYLYRRTHKSKIDFVNLFKAFIGDFNVLAVLPRLVLKSIVNPPGNGFYFLSLIFLRSDSKDNELQAYDLNSRVEIATSVLSIGSVWVWDGLSVVFNCTKVYSLLLIRHNKNQCVPVTFSSGS